MRRRLRGTAGRERDVAIYSPYASLIYERGGQGYTGGAELQTWMLARGLAREGLRTAHVVFPVKDLGPLPEPAPSVVERPEYAGHGHFDAAFEARAVWRGLWRADAACYVIRGSGGHLAVAAKFCRLHKRHLVFSSSNDVDFDFERADRRGHVMRSYRKGIENADRIVVQTADQLELARSVFPNVESLVIPSFAEPAKRAAEHPDEFLWADRLVPYKRPEAYLDLAAALPDARFVMVTMETDETHWAPDLSRRIRRRSAELPNLELVDALPRKKLLDALSRAVAIVKTSEVEGMPNTFLEAWSRGVPALSLSVDPGARIAEHGVGLLAEGSPELLAEHARRLWSDHGFRSEIGDRALAFVRDTHAPEAVARKWAGVLSDVLAKDQSERSERELSG